MSTFALIPARGGSKGIPRKNIRTIFGKPLIAWTIEAALGSARLDLVVVSTEDEEIAAVARAAGATVPFLRPAALATDNAAGIDPVLHAIDALPQYSTVLLLQATSPLRTTGDIDGLMALADRSGAPSIVSICEAADHPNWMYRIRDEGQLEPLLSPPNIDHRQDLPKVYVLNGAMYFARAQWIRARRSFIGQETLGYPMPADRSIDIDGPLDWQMAELLLAGRERIQT